jgi:hypothetical protein
VRIIWAPWWWRWYAETCRSVWLDITINWSFWCIFLFSIRINVGDTINKLKYYCKNVCILFVCYCIGAFTVLVYFPSIKAHIKLTSWQCYLFVCMYVCMYVFKLMKQSKDFLEILYKWKDFFGGISNARKRTDRVNSLHKGCGTPVPMAARSKA